MATRSADYISAIHNMTPSLSCLETSSQFTSSAKSTCSATSNLNESVTRIVPLATDLGIPWLLANWIPIPTGSFP